MRLGLFSSAFYIRHQEVKYLAQDHIVSSLSQDANTGRMAQSPCSGQSGTVTMTGEIPHLTEEDKTDKAIRDVIFWTDKCCKANQSRVWDRVTRGRLF